MRARAAIVIALGACGGASTNTLEITLATAPGSHLLDAVETLKLVITNPHQVETATRTNGGFSISLDLDATGASGALIVDGLDASGALIATGSSPEFPLGALTAKIAIYMATPNTIGEAPLALDAARDEIALEPLSYGAVLAGGRDAAGAASDAIAIYNTYDHTLSKGVALPAPRSGVAMAAGTGHYVYLFGGRDASGAVAANLWRFDTSTAPAGSFLDLGAKPGFERADETELSIGGEQFLISGTPALLLSGLDGSVTARSDVATLPASAASVVGSDGIAAAIFAGTAGVERFRNNVFDAVTAPAAARADASVTALPGGKVLVPCGDGDAIRIDAATGTAETFSTIPSERRTGCAVAVTPRHLVIAGGTSIATGAVETTAEIYDAGSLALIATVPLVVPRTGAVAVALPNDQILILSGRDAGGAPTATLELFTPESLE